eukprot:COSAG03_NODE_21806_length_299_cov_0.760000_1_plen_59_part_01
MTPANGMRADEFAWFLSGSCMSLWDTVHAHLHAGMSSNPRSNTTTPGRPVDLATDTKDS